ncbi:hypothetical protein DXG01_002256 [Tephrocybe rancida]|nr:hypothetical protein DXG01_002256 [Tephrocybe rancida]
MLFKLLFLAVLGASLSVAASATPSATLSDINPPLSARVADYHPIPQAEARGLANAKRLALGLPLKPPTRRSERVSRAPQPSGTPGKLTNVARGYIESKDQDGKTLGFVGKDQNAFGEYTLKMDGDESDRLLVTIDLMGAASGPTDIKTLNGPDADLPFFGGMKGFASDSSDILADSWNHFFIGGTIQTPSNSLPSNGSNTFTKNFNMDKQIESAIWKYDVSTNAIAPQWINADSSSPATYIGILQGILVCTGDKDTFANYYGAVDWVSRSPLKPPTTPRGPASKLRTQPSRSGASSPTKAPSAKPPLSSSTAQETTSVPLSIKEAIALRRAEAKKAQSKVNTNDFISLEDASPVPVPKKEEEDILGRWPVRETIERARSTGTLNLATRSLPCIPSALFEIHLGITPDPLKSVPDEPKLPPSDTSDVPRRKGRGDNPAWFEAQDLHILKIWNNEIVEIQHEISLFGSLKTLDLHQNKLTSLPTSIADLTALTSLDLSHNALTSLPDNIFALPALTLLNLSHNALTTLPMNAPFASGSNNARRKQAVGGSFFTPSVTRAPSPLPCLLILNASDNKIPANAIDLQLPKTLTKVDFSNNPLGINEPRCQSLLQALGALPKLKELRLESAEIGDDAFPPTLFSSPPFPSVQILDVGETKVTKASLEVALKDMKQELSYDLTPDDPPAGIARVMVGKKIVKEAWELELERREKIRRAKHADFDDDWQVPDKPKPATSTRSVTESTTRQAVAAPAAPKPRNEVVKEAWEIEAEQGLLTEGGKRRARAAAAAATATGSKPQAEIGLGSPSESSDRSPKSSSSGPSLANPQYYSQNTQTLTLPPSSPPTKMAAHTRTFSLASPSKSSFSSLRADDIMVPTPTLPLSVIVKQSFAQSLKILVLVNRRLDKSFALPNTDGQDSFLPYLEELNLEGCGLADLVQVTRPATGGVSTPPRSSEKILPLISKLFPSLRSLDLSHNALTNASLTTDNLSGLILSAPGKHGLKHLRLRGNGISELDGFVGISEGFKGNRQVPEWKLDELDIRDNEIGKLPPELGLLPMDVFLVDGNL